MPRRLRIGYQNARTLPADQGGFTLTGVAAALVSTRKVIAAQGTFSLSGQAATLTYSGTPAVTYDNRASALGSDANGIPTLTLHGSATRVWYHPTSGNNANAGTSVTGLALGSMKATITGASGAWQALRNGFGDHLMVPAGVTAAEQWTGLATRTGLSTSYPIVVTTYDPSDPTNSALWRTGEFTLDCRGSSGEAMRIPNTVNKLVFENIIFSQPQTGANTGNLIVFDGVGVGTGTQDYDVSVLFHACKFPGTQITIQYTGTEYPTTKYYLKNFVFRHCAIYRSPDQGVYCVWQDGLTFEDCIFWHSGWGGGTDARDTATIPATVFNHNVYHDCEGKNTLYRRCVFAEGSLHGLMLRCGGQVDDCIFLENPLSILAGGGVHYNGHNPSGVAFSSTGIICLDGVNCEPGTPEGGALNTANCTNGSFFDDFIVAHRTQTPNYNQFAALIHVNMDTENEWDSTGPVPADSYMAFTNGLVYDWTPGDGHATITAQITAIQSAAELAKCHIVSTNNKWAGDAHMGGSTYGGGNSTSIGSVPNSSYDTAALASSLSFGSKALMYAGMCAAPKTHWARTASNLIRAAYGKSLRF